MRIPVIVLSAFFGAALLFSCSDEAKIEEVDHRQNRTQLLAEIDSLQTIVLNDNIDPKSETAALLLRQYTKYAKVYPGDTENVPEFLFKAAGLSRGVDLPLKAIKMYQQIQMDYPGYERNPEIAFLEAFVYDEDLREKDLAKEEYKRVIKKYPGDYWAEQAEERLKTIDLTDEELIELFMEKNMIE